MNIKSLDQSPQVTMFMEREIDVENPDDPDTTIKETQLTQDELGTLVQIMEDGGDEMLIGGMGFFTLGLSCKGHVTSEVPPVVTHVKLSLKLQSFIV
jgi:hypothetical protein